MKKYKCPNRKTYGIIWAGIIIFITCFATAFFALLPSWLENAVSAELVWGSLVIVGLALLGYIAFFRALPQYAAILTISGDHIIWRCPFYKTIELDSTMCKYVMVENSYSQFKGFQKELLLNHGRGDEFQYIYVSLYPLPQKYKGKAATIRSRQGQIAFAYSDELCQHLIKILPENKSGLLISFYNRMQAVDKEKNVKKQKRKRK